MPLTPDQILEIQDIIELHHNAFIANTIGHDALPDEVIDELRDKGLLNKESKDLIKKIYEYGQVLGKLNSPQASQMSYNRFEDYIQKNPQPLTQMQQRAVRMAQVNAGQYCMGLGNVIEKDTGRTLIEADQRFRIAYEDKIKNLTALNAARRESIEKLRSDLGWSTGDWARDMKRIAVTEIMYSTQQGQADYLRKKYGEDVYVARIPNPGACKHCIRLHIGPDGQPRIFKLSTLEEHGSNVGRKQNDWQVVVGPIHPNCVCSMISVPKGWGFNEEGDLVPGGKLGEIYQEPEELEKALIEENLFYKSLKAKANIVFQGIPIAIETPKGDKRKWINGDGSIGETIMYGASYGFVKRTTSMDEEELDVFVGPFKDSPVVYIIDQKNPDNELYDEQKCMLGFRNEEHALNVYRMNYDNPDDFIYDCSSMDVEAFKRWCGVGIDREEINKALFIGPKGGKWANAEHTIPYKDPNLSMRNKASNFYDELISWVKDNKDNLQFDSNGNVYIQANQFTNDKNLSHLHILITPKGVFRGNGIGKTNDGKDVLVLTNLRNPYDTTYLDTRITSKVIIHEISHYLNAGYGKVHNIVTEHSKEYYNQSAEFDAFWNEGAGELERFIRNFKDTNQHHIFERIVGNSPDFKYFNSKVKSFWDKTFLNSLTEANKKKFDKRLYRLWDDLKSNIYKSNYDLSPGPGLGLNYFYGTEVKKPGSGGTIRYKEIFNIGKEELKKRKKQKDNKGIYGDIEDYQFGENVIPVKELVIPDTVKESKKEARKKNKGINRFVVTRRLQWTKGNINEVP
jgi:hypothetical protein